MARPPSIHVTGDQLTATAPTRRPRFVPRSAATSRTSNAACRRGIIVKVFDRTGLLVAAHQQLGGPRSVSRRCLSLRPARGRPRCDRLSDARSWCWAQKRYVVSTHDSLLAMR
jgi:hypothetical protein